VVVGLGVRRTDWLDGLEGVSTCVFGGALEELGLGGGRNSGAGFDGIECGQMAAGGIRRGGKEEKSLTQ
jgi:hypothetical protein